MNKPLNFEDLVDKDKTNDEEVEAAVNEENQDLAEADARDATAQRAKAN